VPPIDRSHPRSAQEEARRHPSVRGRIVEVQRPSRPQTPMGTTSPQGARRPPGRTVARVLYGSGVFADLAPAGRERLPRKSSGPCATKGSVHHGWSGPYA
jgi:hypothetical protein